MNKTEIKIDKNIKYLGEIKNIELPYGCRKRSIPTHSERLIHPQLLLNRP